MQNVSRRSPQPRLPKPTPRQWSRWGGWLDILMLLAWGAVLIKFWVTGQINILLHPNYQWLAHSAAIVLLALGFLKLLQRWRGKALPSTAPHVSLFPPGVGTIILLVVAIVGLIYTPRPFASATALERGISETLLATRAQPQAFGNITRPEDRSLIDWVRTLNVYPEPDAYAGQTGNIDGFVVYDPTLPDNYIVLSRFVITCCAADTYPVGLPIQISEPRSAYPPDQWLAVTGTMATAELNGDRRLVLVADTLAAIAEPKNPYEY